MFEGPPSITEVHERTNVYLTSLYIGCSSTVANMLCSIARQYTNEHSTVGLDLRDLKLQISKSNPTDAGQLLALISNTCPSLRTIDLRLPRLFWTERGCVETFSKVILNKPELKRLVCDFESYTDHDGRILQLLIDFILHCKNSRDCCIESFRITDLHDVSPSQMRRLDELLSSIGLTDCEFGCFDMNGDDDEIHDFDDDDVPILISYFDAQIPNMNVTYTYL